MSGELGRAAQFLIEFLSGGERASAEVCLEAQKREISYKTLTRARRAIGAQTRKKGGKWYVSVPEGISETAVINEMVLRQERKVWTMPYRDEAISSDWVSVVTDGSEAVSSRRGSGLRIKCGALEIEADAEYPAEKLVALLREIGGEVC
ncbi:MAG: hypothetical protein LBJ12_03080 [Oscillospiraceae bacterium]|nr:hypothetical protein [Oscillospiraceae bacterium]